MADLVRRSDVLTLAKDVTLKNGAKHRCIDATLVHEIPSAEPEREMGRWMFSPDNAEGICTNCNYKIYGRPYNNAYLIVPYNFCPNCGADMRGGDNG